MAGLTAQIIAGSKSKRLKVRMILQAMAEVVRRRYTRLLSEGKTAATQKTKNDDDGHAVPDELQKVIDGNEPQSAQKNSGQKF